MVNIPISNRINFYSEKLSGDWLRLYNESVDNLSRGVFTATVRFSSNPIVNLERNLNDMSIAIVCGCPELFFVEQDIACSHAGQDVTLTFKSKYPVDSINDNWAKLDAEINRIVSIAAVIPGNFDKINRINKYLCMRIKPRYSIEGRFGDAYGALILKEARCEGFSKAAKLIFDRLGIPAIVACGNATIEDRTEPHAWNIIAYKNAYYQFDFSWNAANTHHDIPGQEYMFLDDKTGNIQHHPSRPDYPECTDDSKSFWVRNNGIVNYPSDLSRVKIVPFNKNFLAMAKFSMPPTNSEIEDNAFRWMATELSGYSYGKQLSYVYNRHLKLLVFYMINQ